MNRNLFHYLKVIFIWLVYSPVILITYIIVWLDRKIKFTLPFPRNVQVLTNAEEWCIRQLKKNEVLAKDAAIKSYKVTPLNPDLIFRSNAGVIEIGYTYEDKEQVLKCFAKFAPTSGTVWNRTIFNLQLNHIKETWFNRLFVSAVKNYPAPKVYYTEMSFFTGNLCLITEFMDDCIEYNEGRYDHFPDQHLNMAIEGMATLHANHWRETSARIKKVLPIEDNTVHLFDSMVAFSWSIEARNVLVKSWCKMNEPETVLHGDARIGNMMFPKAEGIGRFVFIDWQAVRQGKAAYDLAYFLVLSLSNEHRVKVEKQIIDNYYSFLIAKGVSNYSKQQLEEDYRHACLCVLVLLSLPMLSGEASVEGYGAKVFAWGMNIWRERMEAKFVDFDYSWMAENYGISEYQGREVVNEMLEVIKHRLSRIDKTVAA